MYKVSYCTVPGLGHDREDALSCQDVVCARHNDKVAVACLCDGAGSAVYAREGAEAVSNAVCDYLFKYHCDFSRQNVADKISKITDIVKEAVDREMNKKKSDINDYNCTLLAVMIEKDNLIAIHIGDGLISLFSEGSLSVISAPENGEYKNQTYFVTDDEAEIHIRIKESKICDSDVSVVLMSDGTATSFWYEKEKKIISQDALKSLCEMNSSVDAQEMKEYLYANLFDVISMNTNDDCSLAIISKI